MKYRNYEVGFTFEVPDVFSEVKQSSYNVFDLPEDTMHYFICLDENGDIIRSFSMVKDGPCNSDEDFNNIVKNALNDLEKIDVHVVQENQLRTESGKIIERKVLYDEDMEEDLGILMYFMRVKDIVLISSCYIEEFYDENEDELFAVFNSVKEV